MKTAALLSLLSCLLIGASPQAQAAAYSTEILVNTENEFSGWFSVRVGWSGGVSDDPPVSATLNGVIPGSTFVLSAPNPYHGTGALLFDTASQAAGEYVDFYGDWSGYLVSEPFAITLSGYEYKLTPEYYVGGIDTCDDPSGCDSLDLYWGYWDGTFSIRKVEQGNLPANSSVPDSGSALALLACGIGAAGVMRRLLTKRGLA